MNRQSNTEFDELLQQLALEAQQYPTRSQEQNVALTKLVNAILQSRRLCRPPAQQFLNYDDIYNEAQQELFLYVCQNIQKYNPERGSVMAWVNTLMAKRFLRDARPKKIQQHKTLDDFENIPQELPPFPLAEIVRKCLEEDREGTFKNEHITSCPAANFSAIALRRFEGKTWKEISEEFDISIPTLSSFYKRSLKKLAPVLQEYCLNHED